MRIFHFDPQTLAFAGEGVARVDPMGHAEDVRSAQDAHAASGSEEPFDPASVPKTKFLIPAFATDAEPPAEKSGFTRTFREGAWTLAKDQEPEPENPPPAKTWDDVRADRDVLLAASDWTQLPDTPLASSAVDAWKAYRKALRDLTSSSGDPAAVVFPQPPKA